MADVCDGFYRIFVRNPLPNQTASDQTAQPLYIRIPCDGVHLWRNHESSRLCLSRCMSLHGKDLLAIYISGIPVDLVHASSTFIFL